MGRYQPVVADNPTDGSREEELVRQAVRGESDAFGVLYSLYVDDIYKYFYYRAGNLRVAEDLTENVFLKAWRAIGSYEQQGVPFSSWLYRIARNVAIDYLRTRRVHVPLTDEHVALVDEDELSPLQLLLRREDLEEVQHAVSQLAEEQQQVLILRFVEGLSHAEVGEVLSKTEEACRVLQHRALAALSKLLGESE
jgi:RNA polymerase sigma-70 factor (ECF subfamily)